MSREYPCFVSGASSSLDSFGDTAIKAFQEAESRLIYGLNESQVGTIVPENVRNVLDHELLYAQSQKYHEYIKYLWSGKITNAVPIASNTYADLMKELDAVVFDVSEDVFLLKVVKVLSHKMIPINFGYETDHYTHYTLSGKKIDIPHYFA